MRQYLWILTALCAMAEAAPRERYLVEMRDPPVLSFTGDASLKATRPADQAFDVRSAAVRNYVEALDRRQDLWLQEVSQRLGRPLSPAFRYRYAYSGFALDLSAAEAAELAALPEVRAVERDGVQTLHTDAGPAWIGAREAWAGVPGAAATRGEGMVIGIVDTGINVRHPAFAEVDADGYRHVNPKPQRFGLCNSTLAGLCNAKLIGVHDFTTEGSRNGNDSDGHGSHVAGIAAGNVRSTQVAGLTGAITLRLSGVAPRANLISYKACVAGTNGNSGTCPNSATMAAIDQAIADDVDVINYSIGGTAVDPWGSLTGGGSSAPMRSIANAVRAGISLAVSAGNSGPVPASISSPSNAPWVIAVANATSNRRLANVLTELSSADVPPPVTEFVGAGLAGSVGPLRLVLGEQYGSARCSQGTELDSPPTGASNPWTGQVFNGEIVVCDRGVQARVAKGYNVRAAGGLGMVLVNTEAEGESIVSDDHFLAATHLGYADGVVLKNWIRANPNGARGRLTGVQALMRDSYGDVLAASSSRGADPTGSGVSKPDITAPGSNILAPSGSDNGEATLSGTSMASPHIAGALALLRSRHPDEAAPTYYSALTLTAQPGVRLQDGQTLATDLDAGAGRARVDRALAAGLVLPLTLADFERENPAVGGDPSNLNLPLLYRAECGGRCNFVRTVKAWRADSYTVSDVSDRGVVIRTTPSQFSLNVGETQVLNIQVDVSDPRVLGRWAFGAIEIKAADASIPITRLRSAMRSSAGNVPAALDIPTDADRGYADTFLTGLVELPALTYSIDGPVAVPAQTLALPADTTPSEVFDSETGTQTRLLELSDRGSVRADITQSTAGDVDLFVGRDSNRNGLAEENELLCRSISSGVVERCVLDDQAPGRFWVRVQNASSRSASDSVTLYATTLTNGPAGGLEAHATGPSNAPAGNLLPIRLAYTLAGLLPGERAYASLHLRAGTSADTTFARIPMTFLRTAVAAPAPYVLANDRSTRFTLPPGSAHERLVVDVPAGASQLTVNMRGSTGNADLYLVKATDSTLGLTIPASPLFTNAAAVAAGPDSNETLSLSGSALTAGRWYVVARNLGGSPVTVDIGALVAAQADRDFDFEAWYNPLRDGHGLFFTRAGTTAQMVWYTYDDAGQPTWYLAFPDALTTRQAHVRSDLFRYSWVNGTAVPTRVGQVALVRDGERLLYAWEIDGRVGNEPMQLLASSACVPTGQTRFNPSGLWFEPARSGYGANVFVKPDVDFNVLYLYGGDGRGRWLLGQNPAFGNAPLQLYQYTGYCPSCAAVPVTRQAVGQFTRSFDAEPIPGSEWSGRWSIQANFLPPITGSWNVDNVVAQLLTARPACTP